MTKSNSSLGNQKNLSNALMANPSLNRRTFLKGAAFTGFATFLGSIITPGGAHIAAYADEQGNTSFVVYIMSREEVPIYSVDVSDPENTVPIPNMNVRITSYYKEAKDTVIETTTNDDGMAFVNIKALSFEKDDPGATQFTFYGEVYGTKEGYRSIHMPTVWFRSAVSKNEKGEHPNVIQVPSHSLTGHENEPYLLGFSLDETDIQYTIQKAFVGSYNDAEHTFLVEIATPKHYTNISVKIYAAVNSKLVREIASGTAVASDTNSSLATFSCTGCYLNGTYLKPGENLMLSFGDGSHTYTLETPIEVSEGFDGAKPAVYLNVSPGSDIDGKNDTRGDHALGSFLSGITDVLKIGCPFLPLDVYYDAEGNFGFVVNIFQYSFIREKNGESTIREDEPNEERAANLEKRRKIFGYGTNPTKQIKNYLEETKKNAKEARGMYRDEKGKFKAIGSEPFTDSFEIYFQASFFAYGDIKKNDDGDGINHLAIQFGGEAKFGINYEGTKQFMIAFIPLYAGLFFNLMLRTRFILGLRCRTDLTKPQWGYSEDTLGSVASFIITFYVEAGFTIGVGIKGIAGIAFTGGVYIQLVFTFRITGATEGEFYDKPNPRLVVKLQAYGRVDLHLLFFKTSHTLFNTPETEAYDNWKKSLNNANAQLNGALDVSPSTFDWDNAIMVTEDELANSVEFRGTTQTIAAEENVNGALLAEDGQETSSQTSKTSIVYEYVGHSVGKDALNTAHEATLASDEPAFKDPYDEENIYNPMHGLVPVNQNLIAKNVYNNTRLRVFHGTSKNDELAVTARLVTVSIDDQTVRTRVVVQAWKYGAPVGEANVVDFDADGSKWGVTSLERDDVDFDGSIITTDLSSSEVPCFVLAITSLVRGDTSKSAKEVYEDDENNQFITLLCGTFSTSDYSLTKISAYERIDLRNDEDEPCSVFHPRIIPYYFEYEQPQEYGGNYNGDYSIVVYYRKPLRWIKEGIIRASVGMCMHYIRPAWREDGSALICRFLFDKKLELGDLQDGEEALLRGEFILSKGDGQKMGTGDNYPLLFGWTGREYTESKESEEELNPYSFVSLFRLNFDYKDPIHGKRITVHHEHSKGLKSVANLIARAHLEDAEAFAYTCEAGDSENKEIMLVCYDPDNLVLYTRSAQVRTTSSRFFSSPNGTYLYCVRILETSIPALDESAIKAIEDGAQLFGNCYSDAQGTENIGAPKSTEGGDVQRYQIYEAKWIDSVKAYHDFYPIAQIDFLPSAIDVVYADGYTNGARSFIMAKTTDFDKSTADLYQVVVQNVQGIHLSSAVTNDKFALPKDTVDFIATISNTGNTFINSITVEVTNEEGEFICEKTYDHLEKYIQLSTEHCRQTLDEDDNVVRDEYGSVKTYVEADVWDIGGILWPGSTRTYLFDFIVPENEPEGNRTFNVRIVRANGDIQNQASLASGEEASLASLASIDADTVVARAQQMGSELTRDPEEIAAFLRAACAELQEADNGAMLAATNEIESYINPNAKPFESGVPINVPTTKDNLDDVYHFTSAHYTKTKYQDEGNNNPSSNEADGNKVAKTGDKGGAVIAAAAATAVVGAAGIGAAMAAKNSEDECLDV